MSSAGPRGEGHLWLSTSAFWGGTPNAFLLQRATEDGRGAARSSHGAVWTAGTML